VKVYWLKNSAQDPWREVSKEEWVAAERAAGFYTAGASRPNEPATAAWGSSTGAQGTTLDPSQEGSHETD
jgi:hypothetical protein